MNQNIISISWILSWYNRIEMRERERMEMKEIEVRKRLMRACRVKVG